MIGKSYGRQRLADLLLVSLAGDTAHLQGVADIVRDIHMRPKCIGLKHHRHVAPFRRQRPGGVCKQPLPEMDGAIRRRFKTGDHAQHRCLAAARRPEQCQKAAMPHLQGKVGNGRTACAEILGEVIEDQFRHGTTPLGKRFAISSRSSIMQTTMRTTSTESADARSELPLSSRL